MLAAVIAATPAGNGFWHDTIGLLFTFVVLMPALATGLVVVAMISGRGDKQIDDELRSRWRRRRPPTSS